MRNEGKMHKMSLIFRELRIVDIRKNIEYIL